MKTTLKTIALAFGLLLGTSSIAQNTSIGITGGYQMTTYDSFDFTSPYNGWNAGLTGIYSQNSSWGVGADLIYSRTGGTYRQMDEIRDEVATYRVQSDNIRFTPKFHYFFGDLEDRLRPTIYAGPSLGVLVRAENLSDEPNWTNDFNPVNFAGVLGVGVNYQLINGLWLHANVDYTMGITRLNQASVMVPDNMRSNDLAFNLGIAYSLNKAKKELK